MCVDPQKKVHGTPPLPLVPPFPLQVDPLNPLGVWGGAPAEIEFGAF